jgi:hypothetical protein
MEKNLSPEEKIFQPSKIEKIVQKLLVVLKLFLGILLLPFVYSSTKVFLEQLFNIELKNAFFSGIAFFLLIYLFIWEPAVIYKKGQRFVQIIFGFFSPLIKVAPYLLPIYTIFSFLLYFLFLLIFKNQQLLESFMFLFGLTISFHLVFSAKSLKSKPSDYLKANYIFGFSFVWLVNIIILSFGFNLIFKEYSFVDFFNQTFKFGLEIYKAVFKQLFL